MDQLVDLHPLAVLQPLEGVVDPVDGPGGAQHHEVIAGLGDLGDGGAGQVGQVRMGVRLLARPPGAPFGDRGVVLFEMRRVAARGVQHAAQVVEVVLQRLVAVARQRRRGFGKAARAAPEEDGAEDVGVELRHLGDEVGRDRDIGPLGPVPVAELDGLRAVPVDHALDDLEGHPLDAGDRGFLFHVENDVGDIEEMGRHGLVPLGMVILPGFFDGN